MSPFFVTELSLNINMKSTLVRKCLKRLMKYERDFIDRRGNYMLLFDHIDHPQFRRIIDVGAWWGPWTITWQNNAEHIEIFEPNQEMLPKLKNNISNFKNCTLYETALGNKSGKVSMEQETHSGTYHIKDTHGLINVKTLDSYNFNSVDVIKIDVEGYEIPVLEGARNTILANKPYIQIEGNKSTQRYGYHKADINTYLTKLGMVRIGKRYPDQIWKFD